MSIVVFLLTTILSMLDRIFSVFGTNSTEDQLEDHPDPPHINGEMAHSSAVASSDHHDVHPAKESEITQSHDSHSRRTRSQNDSPKASRSHNNFDAFKTLEKRCRELQRHCNFEAQHHQQTKEQLEDARLDNDRLAKAGHAWQAAAERLKEQLAVAQKQLQQASRLREEDKKLLELRRVELEDAQAFLGSADSISGEEITSMVQALNSDIFQLAASIAESGDFLDDYHCDEATIRLAEKHIGRDLSQLVYASRTQDHDHRQFVVQIALQVALLWVCSNIVDSWVPNLRSTTVEAVYKVIQDSCSQGSAGRWRAMARSRFKYARPAEVVSKAKGRCLRAINHVLRIAGYNETSTDTQDARSSLAAKFGTSFDGIINAAIRLDRAMGEDVISQHAKLLMVKEDGKSFDPKWMEDAYGGEAGRDGVVACSVEFGLELSVRDTKGQEVSSSLPLKTKVVLMASLVDQQH